MSCIFYVKLSSSSSDGMRHFQLSTSYNIIYVLGICIPHALTEVGGDMGKGSFCSSVGCTRVCFLQSSAAPFVGDSAIFPSLCCQIILESCPRLVATLQQG